MNKKQLAFSFAIKFFSGNKQKPYSLTENKVFQNSRSVLGASAILVAHEINIIRDPHASERVEVS